MKGFPARVRVTQRITYEIVFIDSFENENVLGECRFDEKQIVLKKVKSQRQMRSTLLHEIFHAMSFETKQLELTETQVLALEKATDRVLRLNKWYRE